MYKTYRAYTGRYDLDNPTHVDRVVDQINDNGEEIVSVTAVGDGNIHVLIITRTRQSLVGVV